MSMVNNIFYLGGGGGSVSDLRPYIGEWGLLCHQFNDWSLYRKGELLE